MSDNNVKVKIGLDGVPDVTRQLNLLNERFAHFAGRISDMAHITAAYQGFKVLKSTFIDAADEMNDLSQRIGIGIEALAGWELASKQSGASLESIGKGVKGLSGYIVDNGDKLRALGISTKDANTTLIQLADSFAAMPDGIEKTALATKLFGKAGLDMIPMLNLGSKGLQEAFDKTKDYAEKVKELAPHADKFNDQMAELGVNAKGVGMNLMQYVVPALNATIENFINARNAGLGFFESVTGVGVRGMNETLQDAVANSGKTINKLIAERDRLNEGLKAEGQTPASIEVLNSQLERNAKLLTYYRKLQLETLPKASYSNEGRGATQAAPNLKPLLTKDDNKGQTPESAAIQSLTEQLDKASGEASAFDRILARVTNGSWKAFTQQGKESLLVLAQKIDSENRLKAEIDGTSKMLEKRTAGEARLDEQIKATTQAWREQLETMQFDLSIAGLSEESKKRAQALRQIDLKLEKDILAVRKELEDPNGESTDPEMTKRIEALRTTATEAKTQYGAVSDEILARSKSWSAGASDALTKYLDEVNNVAANTERAMTSAFRGMEDALVNFVKTGKLDFKSLTDSILSDMIRMQVQQSVTKPLAAMGGNWLSGLFGGGSAASDGFGLDLVGSVIPSAKGNVFNSPDLHRYANTIVSSPTLFKFAQGGAFNGLMGEAGSEAIMPLKRGPRGDLGVAVHSAGGAPNIAVNVINQTGTQANGKQQGGPQWDGAQWVINVVMERAGSDPHFRAAMGVGN